MADKKTFVDRFCQILVANHTITEEQARIYREQFESADHDSFEYFLYDEGLIEKEFLLKALSNYYQVPSVDVDGYFFDSDLLSNFPKDFLLRNEIIPLELDEDILVVAAADPANETIVSNIGNYVSADVQFQVAFANDICEAVKEYYEKALTEVSEDADLDEERKEQDEFERDGQINGDED